MAITSIKTGSSFTSLIKYDTFLGPNSPYIPSSFESIATVTGNGSTVSLTFSSIPQTYKSLQIRALYKDTDSNTGFATYEMTFNGDTGYNYSHHKLYGDGTSALATGNATRPSIDGFIGPTSGSGQANMYGVAIIDIHDYASTSKYKTVRAISGSNMNTTNTNSQIRLNSGLWQSTSAITSITLNDTAYYFTSGTTFALYGIN